MVSAIVGPTPGSSWATRKPATRSRGFSAQRRSATRVLDMRGVEKLQPAELHERDVAASELEFERGAVVGGAKQHRLRFRARRPPRGWRARGRDEARLIGVVGDGDERGSAPAGRVGPKVLGETLGRERDHRVGGGEDGAARAVVVLERHDARGRVEARGKSRMLRTVAARNE